MVQQSRSDLIAALEQIEREKGVKKEEILKMIEGALVSALKKHIGKATQIEAEINSETAAIKAWIVKKAVENVSSPEAEISLAEASKINPRVQVDEEVRIAVDAEEFSRIAAQTAKQVLIQKMREIERENLYKEYKPREGEVVNGSVHRFVERNIIVDLGRAEAILPIREQIRKEHYSQGQGIRAVILKVDKSQKGPQVILSRASPIFLKRLFEAEVPEFSEKIVEIVNIVRDPGFRAKVMVKSNHAKVDPVGACVGIRGSRIRSIMYELSGERIDLIAHSDDSQQQISNSLSPAKVVSLRILDKEAKRAEAIVANEQLAVAIGKDGHNIRLASKLTGWNIDVKSESQKSEEGKKAHEALAGQLRNLGGVGAKTADILVKAGLTDITRLAGATPQDLLTVQGIGEKTAVKIIASSKKYVAGISEKAVPRLGNDPRSPSPRDRAQGPRSTGGAKGGAKGPQSRAKKSSSKSSNAKRDD